MREFVDMLKTETAERVSRREPIELRRDLDARYSACISKAARSLGVSTETVENVVREYRDLVKRWPPV
jgi:nucleoside-diphosphate-sugar epimerase